MTLPSPSKQCWNEETRVGQGKVVKCTALHKLQHCLGGGGTEEKLRRVLRVLSPTVALSRKLIGSESLLLEKRRNMAAFEWNSIHNKQI